DCKETITVTFTPTITLCSTPTPIPKCCQSSGGPGWQNKAHTIDPANVNTVDNIASSQDCCKACFDDSECLQWAFFSFQCSHHKNKPNLPTICNNTVVDTSSFFDSGIIRCNTDTDICI
ncbi:16271_t:CDS:1, partial [Cetraspora pellucida]